MHLVVLLDVFVQLRDPLVPGICSDVDFGSEVDLLIPLWHLTFPCRLLVLHALADGRGQVAQEVLAEVRLLCAEVIDGVAVLANWL